MPNNHSPLELLGLLRTHPVAPSWQAALLMLLIQRVDEGGEFPAERRAELVGHIEEILKSPVEETVHAAAAHGAAWVGEPEAAVLVPQLIAAYHHPAAEPRGHLQHSVLKALASFPGQGSLSLPLFLKAYRSRPKRKKAESAMDSNTVAALEGMAVVGERWGEVAAEPIREALLDRRGRPWERGELARLAHLAFLYEAPELAREAGEEARNLWVEPEKVAPYLPEEELNLLLQQAMIENRRFSLVKILRRVVERPAVRVREDLVLAFCSHANPQVREAGVRLAGRGGERETTGRGMGR